MRITLYWAGLFFLNLSFGGDINFAGLLNVFSSEKVNEQVELEKKLEENINRFRSVNSSKVLLPVNNENKVAGLWGLSEAKVLPVEVILKLNKRKRLTESELKGIHNLLASSLSGPNQIVQAIVRDEEGYEWVEEGVGVKDYFMAAQRENEITDRLKGSWAQDITWTDVHVSEADASCKITGKFLSASPEHNSKIRQEVMSAIGNLCSTARLSIAHAKKTANASITGLWIWIERGAFALLGFSLWGLIYSIKNYRRKKLPPSEGAFDDKIDDAIVLTQMDGSHDQTAKWMLRAMLSEKAPCEDKPGPNLEA